MWVVTRIDDGMGWGIWLRQQREKTALTQAAMARRLGMSRSNLSQIENERNHSTGLPIPATPDLVRRAAAVLRAEGLPITDYEAFRAAELTVPETPTEPGAEAIGMLDQMATRWLQLRGGSAPHEIAGEEGEATDGGITVGESELVTALRSWGGGMKIVRITGAAGGTVTVLRYTVHAGEMPPFAPGTVLFIAPTTTAMIGDYVIVRRGAGYGGQFLERPAEAAEVIGCVIEGGIDLATLIGLQRKGQGE